MRLRNFETAAEKIPGARSIAPPESLSDLRGNVPHSVRHHRESIDSASSHGLASGIKTTIRQATLSDVPFIVSGNLRLALETERRQLDPATVAAGVNALLADAAKGIYFLAEADGQPVGQLLITREWSDWRNGNFWWIQSVYVLEPFRGRGIFRALFEHVHALAQARHDVCGLRLYVEANNSRAQEAYRRLGLAKTDYELFETDFVLNH